MATTTEQVDHEKRARREQYADRIRAMNEQAADDPITWVEYLLELERQTG